jgi:hypothetical protein
MPATTGTPTPHEVAVLAGLRMSTAQAAVLKAVHGTEELTKDELRAWRILTRTMIARPRIGGYRELWVRAGRRAGKTMHLAAPIVVSALLGSYEHLLSPGEKGRVVAIGPTLAHLRQLLDGIAGVLDVLAIPYDRRENEIELRQKRTIVVGTVADHLGPRGPTSILAVIDEGALLPFDANADGFDQEVLAAVRPSLATTRGKLLVLSSPWARAGEHYRMVEQHLGKTKGDVLAVHGATWLWNPSLDEAYTHTLEQNPGRWSREWKAEAGDNESSAFASRDVTRAITAGVVERPPVAGRRYGAAGDLAFRADGAAFGIAHKELVANPGGPPKDRLVVDVLRVRRAPPGGRLDPEALIEEWASCLKRYHCKRLYLDSFGFDLAASRFKARGIKCELLDMSLPRQAVRYDALGGRLRSGAIDLPDNEVVRRELCDLRVTLLAAGAVRYEAPRRGSDDTADVCAALCGEACKDLPPSGGDVRREVRVRFDNPHEGLDIDVRWSMRQPNGSYLPCSPPRGTVEGERALRERRALGIVDVGAGDPPLDQPLDDE